MPHTCAGATVLPPVHVRLRVAVGPWRVGTVEWTPCFVSLRVSYAFEHELRCAALKLYRNYMDKAKGAARLREIRDVLRLSLFARARYGQTAKLETRKLT